MFQFFDVTVPPSAPVTLRRANAADLAWLLPLAKRIFCETFEAHYQPHHFWGYVDRAYAPEVWQAELANPDYHYVGAWVGEQPIGYLKLSSDYRPEVLEGQHLLEVAKLYVDQRYHGQGVAQRLMEHALSYAEEHGFDGLWLGVWEHNHRAMAFYRKYGFEIVGTHPFEMGAGLVEDDFVMRRSSG